MMRDHARTKSDRHGFTVHVCQIRPESRGYVALKSLDPSDHELIQPNYLATENDRRTMRDGVRVVRNILAQSGMDDYPGPEFISGAEIQNDAEINVWIRAKAATT